VGCNGCELHRAGQPESHCYAAGLVRRYAGLPGWPASFDQPEPFAGRIEKACTWPDLTGRKRAEKPWLNGYPRLIFVCDLADPFTESIDPESWLTPALPRMAASPHIFLLLTKRGRRMFDYFERHPVPRNFWLGVTVTGPDTTARIDYLLKIRSASVRFVSMEPLLSAVNIGRHLPHLDWVVVGGESGQNARPMVSNWAFDVHDACIEAGVPFFFKQFSEWIDCGCAAFGQADYGPPRQIRSDGTFWPEHQVPTDEDADVVTIVRAGIKAAGTEFCGREWHQMPEVRR